MAFLAIPHLGFIVAAFAVAAGAIAVMIFSIVAEHRRLKRELARHTPKPVGRNATPNRAA